MLISKTFNSEREMLDFFRGTEVARGTAGTSNGITGAFSDATTGAFTGVLAGDVIVISGETTTAFTVSSLTDVNNLTLGATPSAHAANAVWRAYRGGQDPAKVVLGPMDNPFKQGSSFIVYDLVDFDN